MNSFPAIYIKRPPLWLVAILGYGMLIVALWLPTGLRISGWGDEWLHMLTMDILPLDLRMDIRPLLRLPWAIAYWFTPNSFLGIHILLALTFFLKGLALYGIVRRLLPGQPALAYAAGALLIVYPTDDATFNMAVLGIHLSLASWLVATFCLLSWWKQLHWLWVVGIWGGLIVSLGIVEIGYPLVMLTPLLLAVIEHGFQRRMLRAAVLWYSVLLLPLLWAVLLLARGENITGYQSSKFAADNTPVAYLTTIFNTYRWHLWDAWSNTIPNSAQRLADPLVWLALGVTVINAAILWWHGRTERETIPRRTYELLVLVGLVALVAGFAAFLPSNLRDLHERTTIFSAVGAALVVVAVAWGTSRLPLLARLGLAALFIAFGVSIYSTGQQPTRFMVLSLGIIALGFVMTPSMRFALLATAVVGIGTGFIIDQHKDYVEYARRQQPTVTAILTDAPSLKSNTYIVVFSDQNERPYQDFLWRNDIFAAALRYLYSNPNQRAALCYAAQASNPQPSLPACILKNDLVQIEYADGTPSVSVPYSQLLAFAYSGSGEVQLLATLPPALWQGSSPTGYDPIALIDLSAPVPARLISVYGE
ncbi:MAG: hypothetical protein R3E39_12900 [Anaerolineae bacterium]